MKVYGRRNRRPKLENRKLVRVVRRRINREVGEDELVFGKLLEVCGRGRSLKFPVSVSM